MFSTLPGLQLFAEHGYADAVDPALLRANFRGSCDAVLDDWLKASDLDSVPGLADPAKSCANVSAWLLWQDPLLALMDPEVAGGSLRGHYEKLSAALFRAAKKTRASRRLIFPARLARALALKCELRRNLAEAYAAGNRRKLTKLLEGDLAALRKAVEELWKCHRDLWLATYKPFGLEVIEKRYGGLRARLESLSDRLYAYLQDDITRKRPSVDLILELLCDTEAQRWSARKLLGDGATLLRAGLIRKVDDPHSPSGSSGLAQFLKLDARIGDFLWGGYQIDARLAGACRLLRPSGDADKSIASPTAAGLWKLIERHMAPGNQDARKLVIFLHGPHGVGKRELALDLCERLNMFLLSLDAELLLAKGPDAEGLPE